jgi:protein-tyrosine phosphatase
MDEENLRDLHAMAPHGFADRVQLFMAYCDEPGCATVPDPYYGGAEHFEQVLDLSEKGVRGLLRKLRQAAHRAD